MAKLSPEDPQFGIPIACRINGEIAPKLNKEAELVGKTFSRYVAEYIEKISALEKKVEELSQLLTKVTQYRTEFTMIYGIYTF